MTERRVRGDGPAQAGTDRAWRGDPSTDGIDWSATGLGEPARWPQSLRTAVSIVMGSRHPMFLAWGPALHFVFNEAYAPILGVRAAGAQGRPFAALWPEIWPDIEPLVARALAGEATWSEDLPLVMTRHGYPETTYFTFSYSPIRDETGGVGGLFCACTETTAKVIAERENARLLAQRQDTIDQLRQMFEQAPGFVAVLRGPELRFELVNEAYRQLVGHRDLVGLRVREALPEVEGQGFFELLEKVQSSREPVRGEGLRITVQRTPDAAPEVRYVDFVYQPLLEADGAASGIFVQGHDVTEQVLAVEELRQADRRKDEFLAMLAHELRNPLAPLSNALRLLERSGENGPSSGELIAMAERQARQLRRLVDDLLEVSRITQGKIELRFESVDVAAAARHAIESVGPECGARRHRLSLKLPPEPLRVRADPARLAQILENLLHNACKYTPDGGNIRLEVAARGAEVELRVVDDGIGVDPDKLHTLFVLFSQIDATLDRAHGGLGIGLAMVRRLAELHGGTVAAHSDGPGRGSCFMVRLPRLPH